MNLSIKELEDIQEFGKLTPNFRAIVSILIVAINDWPSQIENLYDYENKICNSIGGCDIDKAKLEEYISGIDYSKKAWEGESLSQLKEIYNYYEASKSLKKIFQEVEFKLSNIEPVSD